ncbi:MAG: Crp/Fnr family transcriptional regulator [Acidovorax sp.]
MTAAPLDLFLAQSPWMSSLTAEEAARVRKAITVRSYPAGGAVFARSTPTAHWAGVMQGMLKLDNITAEGRTSTFAGVPSGAWFGEGSVLKDEPRPYAVTALTDSVVALLPRSEFLRLLHESHPFALWLIGQLNARLARACSHYFRGREGPCRRANLGARRSVCPCTRKERNDEWRAGKGLPFGLPGLGAVCGVARACKASALLRTGA